jgi:spore maturation protein CgeB
MNTENNSAYVGLNWSSLQDINARFFEAMAMKQVLVANRLPHIEELGLEEDRHYLGFDTVEEAVEKVAWARANQFKFADAIANNGYQLVHERHTYENRIQQIFNDTGI